MESLFPNLWLGIIGFFLLYYAVTDGFGLGVGILCLFSKDNEDQQMMIKSLTYIWHTNQTWLVLVGGMLFGAFPIFYSVLFTALYIPAVIMLLGLLLRGVAIDFYEHSSLNRFWAVIFGTGSLIATVAQGLALGGLLGGILVEDGHFVGNIWDWANSFAILIAVGVIVGYVTLGCNYLILKTEGGLQKRMKSYAFHFSALTAVLSLAVFLGINLRYPQMAEKWLNRPQVFYMTVLLLLAISSFIMLFRSLHLHQEVAPLFWNAATVVMGFTALSINMYPYMIPDVISPVTIRQAAASQKTLTFMLAILGILIPVMLFYTMYTYRVFRGKVTVPYELT
jgi:cytochrome d ubiquinol oxidase subunit II